VLRFAAGRLVRVVVVVWAMSLVTFDACGDELPAELSIQQATGRMRDGRQRLDERRARWATPIPPLTAPVADGSPPSGSTPASEGSVTCATN
jgi:hypothetical protein